MKRLTILFIVLCLPIVMAEERDRQAANRLPIYRGAEPHITELLAVTPTWGGTVEIGNFEQWLESYPQSMLPWKPEELKDVKIYLPLGEGESIDDKIYRFQVAWGDKETPAPLHIVNDRASWEKWQHAEEPNSPLHSRAFRYRPLEMEKDNVVRFKFEFVPVKFKPIATWEGMGNMMRFTNAPVPEFLDPLVINTAQMRVLVNERSDGFSIHFSNDGERWYRVGNRPNYQGQMTMPRNLLPFETLYVRIATNNNVPIGSFSLDFEAILETRGFRGTGTTGFGRISTNRVNFPLAFYDGNDDLVLLIDNPGEEPFQTGSHHRNFRGGGFSFSFSSPRGGGM